MIKFLKAVRAKFARVTRLKITTKTTIIFTALFTAVIIFFAVFFILNLERRLPDTEETRQYLLNLRVTTSLLIIILLALTAALGALASQAMLRPINKMISQMDGITSENLSARLHDIDAQDELTKLSARINAMLDQIESGYNRQADFVSDASHELRTPVSVIRGYGNLLKRWGKEKPEVLEEGIGAILKEAENMSRLIEQLLLLARLGKYSVNKTEFYINELLEDVVKETRVLYPNKKIVLKKVEGINYSGDKELIKQAVRVIVDNAAKYTNDAGSAGSTDGAGSAENAGGADESERGAGGKKEKKPAEKNVKRGKGGEVSINCFADGDKITVSVSDDGIGISKGDLAHIFERFYRCDKARSRNAGSTGLGLSIAKAIIDAHGGGIEVESEVDKGSEFRITLPAGEADIMAEAL